MSEANEKTLWVLAEIIFIVLIASAIFYKIYSMQNDTSLEKNYLARDLALLVNTMYSAPSNLEYTYIQQSVKLNRFNFAFLKQNVIVTELDGKDRVYYWYADNRKSGSLLDAQARSPDSLSACFVDGKLNIASGNCKDITRLKCPEIDTLWQKASNPIVILNPSAGGSDFGRISMDEDAKESEIARQIAQQIKNIDGILGSTEVSAAGITCYNGAFTICPLRNLEMDLEPTQQLTAEQRARMLDGKSFDLLLTISIGKHDPSKNPVNVYVPSGAGKENEKLACMLANALLDSNPEVDSISPVLEKNDDLMVTGSKAMAVEIEIGNLDNREYALLESKDLTAKIIHETLKEYYGKQ